MMAAGLAVALAREGMPFRKAHALVGSLVAEAQKRRSPLREVAARACRRRRPALVGALDAHLRSRRGRARQGRARRHRAGRGAAALAAARARATGRTCGSARPALRLQPLLRNSSVRRITSRLRSSSSRMSKPCWPVGWFSTSRVTPFAQAARANVSTTR